MTRTRRAGSALCAPHGAAPSAHTSNRSSIRGSWSRTSASQTNTTGFCPDHLGKLYQGENKLGLGLVVLTHLQEKLPVIRSALEGAVSSAQGGRRDAEGRGSQGIIVSLETMRDDCFVCGLLSRDLDRYTFTILYLWRRDRDFAAIFRASRGFCLSHFCAVTAIRARAPPRPIDSPLWLREAVPLMAGSLATGKDLSRSSVCTRREQEPRHRGGAKRPGAHSPEAFGQDAESGITIHVAAKSAGMRGVDRRTGR